MAQNLPRGTPARVLVLLTLLTGLVTVSVWRDALQRPGNTWVRYPTALGDTGLLQPGNLPATLATGGGRVTLSAAGPPSSRRDDRMFRVRTGMEAMLPFSLFTAEEDLAANPDPKLYARTAPHTYQRLRAVLGDPVEGRPASGPAALPQTMLPGERKDLFQASQSGLPPAGPAEGGGSPPPAAMSHPGQKAALPQPPQVPFGEDPDQALAQPAAAAAASPATGKETGFPDSAVPDRFPPDSPAPAAVAEPPAPKAVPLPSDEQDAPVEEGERPTL